MDTLFVLREQLQQIYGRYSKYIDKAVQFILALAAFYIINHNIGFMRLAASPVVTLGLAVICTFLPINVTVLMAAGLALIHMYSASLGIMAVTAVIFLVMFIFFFRFTPKMSVVVLLMPIAFMLKIPYAIPVACGLLGVPVSAVPIIFGTVIYFMMDYLRASATVLKSGSGMLTQVSAYVKQVFQSKEMWVVIIAFIICLFAVYTIRRRSVDHAWKIAAAAGAVINIIVIAVGDIVLNVHTSYVALIIGNIAAVIAGLILEFLFFGVDYSRSESLQYEDDEYYYFVKAIPKIVVAVPEKTVKRINERQETEIIDTEEIRKKADRKKPVRAKQEPRRQERPAAGKEPEKEQPKRKPPKAKGSTVSGNTEHILLTQRLREELKLDKDE